MTNHYYNVKKKASNLTDIFDFVYVYQKALITFHIFNNKITFVNSQRENTNSIGDFVLRNRFETFVLKISGLQLRFGMTNSINKHLRFRIS